MTRWVFLGLAVMSALGCKKPPPAPEGLDDSAKYLFREFYSEDEFVGAGLTGLVNWFDEEGHELLGQTAELDDVGAFSLTELGWDDIEGLPVDGNRDPAAAPGVVSVAEMSCHWSEAEALLTRPDQHVVFEDDFDAYERTFITPKETYAEATASSTFDEVTEPLDPADPSTLPSTVMWTDNWAMSSEMGVTLEFPLVLHFRHGVFEVQGEDAEVLMILAFQPERAEGDGGNNSLEQSYSVEVNIDRGGDKTLRMLAAWTQVESIWLASDSAAVLTAAVNKSQDSAARMSSICAGEVSIPGA